MTEITDDFRRGRHVVFDLNAHIVFVTKYRRGAISDRVRSEIILSMRETCERFAVTLLEADGEDDHIHLLVSYPPKVSLSVLVMALKVNSSKRLREQDWSEVRRTGKDHFWSPSYFVASCGGAPLERIAEYVRNQRKTPRGPGRPKRSS